MKRLIRRLTPPGARVGRDAGCIVIYALFLLVFFPLLRFSNALDAAKIIARFEETPLPGLTECLRGCFVSFWIYLVACAALAGSYYRSFRKKSRSDYLMHRLGRPLEMHIRCLALPLACLALGAVVTALMIAACRNMYLKVPEASLVEIDLWRVLTW